MAAEPQPTLYAALDRLAGHLPGLGIALSGGGDSVALLHMAAAWGRARGIRIEAATVDHALREGSGAEAVAAGRMADALGVDHRVLRWTRCGAPSGNLMAAARVARYALLADWAGERGLAAVALGHTQDDQAETLLMRLARGAGVDGLSGMADTREEDGILWLRPLLGVGREALRDWLRTGGIGWIDDPSNENADFDRVRVRRAIATLDLPAAGLAQSAANLAEARQALAECALAAAQGFRADRGVLWLPADRFGAAPPELRRRLLVAALRWVTGADYPPRREPVAHLAAELLAGRQATLDGVIARLRGNEIEMVREPAAATRSGPAAPGRRPGPRGISTRKNDTAEVSWDRRWRLTGLPDGATVISVAQAGHAGRDWRVAGLPREAVLSSPAVVTGTRVILPLLDEATGIGALPLRGAADFARILRAH